MIDISKLNEAELIAVCPYISIMNEQKMPIDDLGYSLSLTFQGRGPFAMAHDDHRCIGFMTLPRDYWAEIKKEIYQLICTKDRKYASIRTHFRKNQNTSTTAIVGMVSATVGSQLGAAAGIVTPLVALLLYSLLKVGVSSWCNLMKKEISPPSPKKRNKNKTTNS